MPTIATLRARNPAVGHTEFEVTLPASLATTYRSYSFSVRANGIPVLVDGFTPDEMQIALSPSDSTLEFGLENLDFAGGKNGCERIDLELSLTPATKAPVSRFGMWREYIALRAADAVKKKGPGGTPITWSGTFYPGADRRELVDREQDPASAA